MLDNPIPDFGVRPLFAQQIGVEQVSHLKREVGTNSRPGLTNPAKASRYSTSDRRGARRTSSRRTTSGTPTRNAERITSAWHNRVFPAAASISDFSSPSTGTGRTGEIGFFIVIYYRHNS